MDKDKKVVFVEPMGAYSNVFSKFMTIPMLGPLYLGTIAKQAGYDVSVLNENILGRKISAHELADVDILCLSCMTATVERGKEIALDYTTMRAARHLNGRTLIGGIHASMIPDDVVDYFDQVFVGEAETKILDVLNGTIEDKIVYGERIPDLDLIPIPDFQLLKHWERIKSWPIMTSRGCPYNCTFCSVTEMFGRGYRTRSIERVMEDIESAKGECIFFVDDHFVVNKKRTSNLLNKLKIHDIKTDWSCQLRADVSRDTDLVARMRDAGCRTVYIGFESINPSSLVELNKGQSVEDIRSSIKVFRNHGINVHGMFMFGSDSDKGEIFPLTSKFCIESGLNSVQYLILTPLPGTVFYKKIEAEGRLLHKHWQYYDAMHVVFRPRHFTPAELQQGMIECFSDFYSYANAFHDAIHVFFNTIWILLKRIYQKAYFPSLRSALIKLGGKYIVKNWIKSNRPYLGYLNILSLDGHHQKD